MSATRTLAGVHRNTPHRMNGREVCNCKCYTNSNTNSNAWKANYETKSSNLGYDAIQIIYNLFNFDLRKYGSGLCCFPFENSSQSL